MPLDPLPSGAALTALKDNHLSLEEWQDLIDVLVQWRATFGDLSGLTGTLTEALAGFSSSQSLFIGTTQQGLRITPGIGEELHQVRIEAEGLGIEDTFITAVDKTIDVATTGLLGRDTGTEESSTWYYVWVGLNPDTLATTAIFSKSETKGGLTLSGSLADYTKWRRVGARFNDSGGDLRGAFQDGISVLWDANSTDLNILADGTATTITTQSAATFAPETAQFASILAFAGNTGGAPNAYIYHGDSLLTGSDIPPIQLEGESAVVATGWIPHRVRLDASQTFSYRVTSGSSLTVKALGYEDAI